ncbi:RNA cytidine acetyltransferase [Halotydeus destructor]|nr:RNA cytidine acetyltransferase [Halotydeus destructor]
MRKKIDNRLRVLIENGVNLGHRSLFVIVGEQARDQVVILHHILANAQIKARPSVLWCYSKELGFTTHRRKRQRLQQNKLKAGVNVNEDDPFELFIASTTIRWCYYNESQKILGNTYGMLVLQDFEAITPNLLARTIETIEGGGIVVLLLNTLTSLKQLYTMSMDVHDRYRTEAHQDVVSRFNERFILALASCKSCVVLDDKLTVLPISSHVAEIDPIPKTNELSAEALQLRDLAQSLSDVQPAGSLVSCCKTLDQAKVVLKFIDALSEKTLKSTVSLTAARGRGKSAALGLAIAAAIGFNYSNIYVTSPSPENLKTLFDFILKGFEAIKLQEHLDYEVVHSSNTEFNKAVIRINVFRDHRQTIQYIHPSEVQKGKVLGSSSELVVIDEAAAIPLPIVKSLFGPYLVFLASTINGYEGTGRSLSLKLLKQLRQQSALSSSANSKELNNRILHEITLNESIRYKAGDQVEMWLNSLLCLDAELAPKNSASGCPVPEECELYFINRDTLFSFHKASESFLQKLMALYVASHYKNSPNDLQMMSDAPAHQLFCLLSPLSEAAKAKGKLPEVLCFIQVCLEGQISKDSIMNSLSRGKRASGDLIPWTVSQQFQDNQFASLSGARVVRIATNPNYQGMGYGTMALKLLEDYYKGHFNDIEDSAKLEKSDESDDDDEKGEGDIAPKKSLPPLLSKLSERNAERLDYMGVSFGLTGELFRFWKKNGYVPVYMRQTPNELTGEHSCIVLKMLADDKSETDANEWLVDFFLDFQKRFISLLGYQFSSMRSAVALNILAPNMKIKPEKISRLTKHELDVFISLYDLRRLEMYSQNMVDYHLIVDLLPAVSRLYFLKKFGDEVTLSAAQAAILLSIGLQHKQIEIIEEEMQLPVSQILGLFNRGMRKLSKFMKGIEESAVEESLDMPKPVKINMKPVAQSLEDELEDGRRKGTARRKGTV